MTAGRVPGDLKTGTESNGLLQEGFDNGVRYPTAMRAALFITLILHAAGVVTLMAVRLSSVKLHHIYEGSGGLRSLPEPGGVLAVEILLVYGSFIGFLIWIAISMYRGDDALAGKAYSVCAFVAALVMAGRYYGRQAAGFDTAPTPTILMTIWFVVWSVAAATFSFRAARFRSAG